MKRIFVRTLCAFGLAGFGTSAFAVPIQFDFVGKVTSTMGYFENKGLEGLLLNGSFYYETDRMTGMADPYGKSVVYEDNVPTGISAELNLGGFRVQYPDQPESNSLSMGFFDFCDGAFCTPGLGDFIQMTAGSSTVPAETWSAPGFTGSFSQSYLTVGLMGDDLFNWETVDPADLLTMTLPGNMFGSYSNSAEDCNAGSCAISAYDSFAFNIESVRLDLPPRYPPAPVPDPVAVPEPGTLGLMALGLAGMLPFRRRVRLLRNG